MKIDDDTMIDLPRWAFWNENKFKKQLNKTKTGLAFFGYLIDASPTIRDKNDKWYLLTQICWINAKNCRENYIFGTEFQKIQYLIPSRSVLYP